MRLWRGSMGDRVLAVQRTLSQGGFYNGALDGYYGPVTEAAVRDWQAKLRLPVTGEFDGATAERSRQFLGMLAGLTETTVMPPHAPRHATTQAEYP